MPCYGNGVLIEDGGGGGGGCTAYNTAVYLTGSQLVVSTVKTVVDFNTKEAGEDPSGFFNLATDAATIPYTGNWNISATCELNMGFGGPAFLAIEINQGGGYVGYAVQAVHPPDAGLTNLNVACTKYLQQNDLVQIYVQQNSGFNASTNGASRLVNCQITSACIP